MRQPPKTPAQTSRRAKWLTRLGFALLALSFIIYAGFLLIPFIPLSAAGKVALGTAIVIAGEICAWAGTLLLGSRIVVRYRRFLNPWHWFHRKH